jgi:hypothetical protein
MAGKVFSYVRIRRKETLKGIIAGALGAGSAICLLVLILVSFARQGRLPEGLPALAYLGFLLSGIGLYISVRLRQDSNAYGPFIHGALYVNLVAVGMYVLVFLIGFFSMLI